MLKRPHVLHLFLAILFLCATSAKAQTNTFPASGNVGIGTTSPTVPLSIDVDSNVSIIAQTGSTTGISLSGYYPTVGFNNYYNTGTGQWLSIAAGYTGFIQFVPPSGNINFSTGPNTTSGSQASALATAMTIQNNGDVGIGTTNPQYSLSVNGTIQAKEVLVNAGWSDYVFAPEYKLRSLTEVAAFIKANHRLPDIPSEAEVKENGVSLGDMQSKLLAKIEELTLQMIQLNKKNMALEKKVAQLEKR